MLSKVSLICEQAEAQKFFHHYFERYVTGSALILMSILVNQLRPTQKFDELYLRNMKIWQLEMLTRAAALVHELQNKLPHIPTTTQLMRRIASR